MMYPVIGAYRLGDKVRIEVDGVLREGKIICIGLNGYVVAADACVFVVNDPQIKWCARTSGEDEPGEEIKVGDIVRVKVNAPKDVWRGAGSKAICTRYKFLPFEVTGIEEDGIETMAYATSLNGFIYIRIPTRYLEPYYSAEHVRRMEEDLQREREQHLREHSDKDKPHDNTITIPVKADLDDTYWDAYKAELASKIAVAYAEKGRFAPDEIGGFAVRVANDVVDNLKKQSE